LANQSVTKRFRVPDHIGVPGGCDADQEPPRQGNVRLVERMVEPPSWMQAVLRDEAVNWIALRVTDPSNPAFRSRWRFRSPDGLTCHSRPELERWAAGIIANRRAAPTGGNGGGAGGGGGKAKPKAKPKSKPTRKRKRKGKGKGKADDDDDSDDDKGTPKSKRPRRATAKAKAAAVDEEEEEEDEDEEEEDEEEDDDEGSEDDHPALGGGAGASKARSRNPPPPPPPSQLSPARGGGLSPAAGGNTTPGGVTVGVGGASAGVRPANWPPGVLFLSHPVCALPATSGALAALSVLHPATFLPKVKLVQLGRGGRSNPEALLLAAARALAPGEVLGEYAALVGTEEPAGGSQEVRHHVTVRMPTPAGSLLVFDATAAGNELRFLTDVAVMPRALKVNCRFQLGQEQCGNGPALVLRVVTACAVMPDERLVAEYDVAVE
jgi:hypothetical protein